MSLILDLIIIVTVVIILVNGVKRGFVKSVMSLITTVAAFFAAWFLTPPVSLFLDDRFFSGAISSSVEKTLRGLLTSNGDGYNVSKLFEDSPEAFSSLLDSFGVDRAALAADYGSNTAASDNVISSMADTISAPVSSLVSKVVAFIGLFLAALLVLVLLTAIINLFTKLPVIRSANRLLGFVFGLIMAALAAIILSKLFSPVINLLSTFNPKLFDPTVISKTVIVKHIAAIDILGLWSKLFP
ncbi:MAG: CvpA family protein [Clostridia bacterium]|nr:CvpA family protein [Clostridia bacterium]